MSIKIGIDLEKIRPIPGCLTFVEDITTRTCQQLLKEQLGDKRADVVLNDGAPNIGATWSKDAFTQLDLSLSALKLACIVLKQGGVFITKVFRSNDYNSFIWVCN
jgi:AdoMet-dependent rRNA methyltransferase SPB1